MPKPLKWPKMCKFSNSKVQVSELPSQSKWQEATLKLHKKLFSWKQYSQQTMCYKWLSWKIMAKFEAKFLQPRLCLVNQNKIAPDERNDDYHMKL